MIIFTEEFWEKPTLIFFRWLFFIPIYLLSIGIISYLYSWGIKFAFWLFFSVWGFFLNNLLGGVLSTILLISLFAIPFYAFIIIQVCPKAKAGSIVYIILIILETIGRILSIINNVEGHIGKSIGLSILALIPYIALFNGAWKTKNDNF